MFFSVDQALPSGGVELNLYPNTEEFGKWVVALSANQGGASVHTNVNSEVLLPLVAPVGATVSATPSVEQPGYWTLRYDARDGSDARECVVHGRESLLSALKQLLNADNLTRLVPVMMQLAGALRRELTA